MCCNCAKYFVESVQNCCVTGEMLFLLLLLSLIGGSTKMETATFGMGCFWCSEAMFTQIAGVESVQSGFSGGTTPNPSYRDVCTGDTGHAEVVQMFPT